MADALLAQLIQSLNSFIQTEFTLLAGVKQDIENLSSTLSTILTVIEDAEVKQHTDKAISNWLHKLKDAAYDAADILDVWLTEARLVITSSSCFQFHHHLAFRYKIATKIKQIIERIDHIASERRNFHFEVRVDHIGLSSLDLTRETSSVVHECGVYGRNQDKEEIIKMLISSESFVIDVSVIAIVGIGGIGKTTLAQLVYNDEEVEKHFEERIWVCVGEDFGVKRVIRLIVESLSGEGTNLEGLDSMQRRLRNLLTGKKFLLVLDDVWNEDVNKWNTVKNSIKCGAKGSSVIITTRLETAGLRVCTFPEYQLTPLLEADCLALFMGRAFGDGWEDGLCRELVEVGKQILKKCRGVPLAVTVLGALLCFKREVSEWLIVRDSEIWKLPEGGAILGVLRLSYTHLLPHMRRCFSYCSVFPKDCVMKKEELIQLWMANGFLDSDGGMELEDTGNQVFNELLRGSFFQDAQRDEFGNIVSCKMHDLMHDLACSVMGNECCFLDVEREMDVFKGVRHLSLMATSLIQMNTYKCLCKTGQSLRTHLLIGDSRFNFITRTYENIERPHMIFKELIHLRVLDLRNSCIEQVPASIGQMRCLRYLDLSRNKLSLLPKSICRLVNLQTLKLVGCSSLKVLPKYMKNMISLRHLDLHGCHLLNELPTEMGKLVCLQTLRFFNVQEENGWRISELKRLKHLRGELRIKGLESVKDSTEAKEADMGSKRNLSSLMLYWGRYKNDLEEKKSEGVLECLQPHQNLNKLLFIERYGGVSFPNWINLLPNLVELNLRWCRRCETLPSLGQLPKLKVLSIRRMDSLKYIGIEFYGEGTFPSLEKLYFKEMPNLEKWEQPLLSSSSLDNRSRGGFFPSLRELTINNCPKLDALPLMPCVQVLNLEVCKKEILGSLKNFCGHLTFLKIDGIPDMVSFQEGSLCGYTVLLSLSISACNELVSFQEESFQHLVSLRILNLSTLPKLISVPALDNLSSLKTLEILDCNNVRNLPQGIQHLTSLQSLTITRCNSDLLKRTKIYKGEEWLKVSKIPKLSIR